MDKYFLLTYTKKGMDGFVHSYHAWFETEEAMCAFVRKQPNLEIDVALEILSCREVDCSEKKQQRM